MTLLVEQCGRGGVRGGAPPRAKREFDGDGRSRCGWRFQGDGAVVSPVGGPAESFELGDLAEPGAVGVDAAFEVVSAEFVPGGVVIGEDVPHADEDAVADGLAGATLASLGSESGVAGQIGRASCRERVCQYV